MSSSPTKPFGAGRGDGESVRSPYAPKRNRTTADSAHGADDDPPPPRFLVSSRDEEREDLTNFTDSSLQFRESPIPQSTRRSPLSERRSTYATAEHGRGESTDDIDLQRLEESVRRLQREAAVSRLRPPTDEQPVDHPGDARVQRRRSDTYIDGYRVPPSLQPEVLTPPAEYREGNGRLWTVLSMLIASAVAAPIAYYFAAGGSSPSSEQRLASAESRPTVETLTLTAPTIPARPPRAQERVDGGAVPEIPPPVTTIPRRAPGAQAAPTQQPPAQQPPAPQPPAAQAPAPQPPAPQPPAQRVERTPPVQTVERTPPPAQRVERAPPPPAQSVERAAPPPQVAARAPQPVPTRTLDPAEVDVLVKQGQQFVAAGDFVTARLVFQRAAEAGNAAAALALGASYDPVVLSRLGVRGVDADVGKARTWYQKAKEFGAPDADRRLSTLANR
jgi:hypothetical protein